jgi:hypothetical protein
LYSTASTNDNKTFHQLVYSWKPEYRSYLIDTADNTSTVATYSGLPYHSGGTTNKQGNILTGGQ